MDPEISLLHSEECDSVPIQYTRHIYVFKICFNIISHNYT
jgi:hypothetical protein